MGKARAPHMLPPAAQGRARTDPMAKPFGARGLRRKYAAKNRDAIQKSAAPPPCTPPQLLAGALKCVRDRGAGGRCSGRPTSTSPLIGRRPVPHLRVGVSFLRLCMQTVHRRCSNCHVTSADCAFASLPTTTCTKHSIQWKRSFGSGAGSGIRHLRQW